MCIRDRNKKAEANKKKPEKAKKNFKGGFQNSKGRFQNSKGRFQNSKSRFQKVSKRLDRRGNYNANRNSRIKALSVGCSPRWVFETGQQRNCLLGNGKQFWYFIATSLLQSSRNWTIYEHVLGKSCQKKEILKVARLQKNYITVIGHFLINSHF